MRHTPRPLAALLLLGLAAVAALPVYAFSYLYPALTGLIIAQREEDARQVVAYLASRYQETLGEAGIGPHLATTDFPATVAAMGLAFDLIKVKAFAPDGTVVYSTDQADVGQRNTHDYFATVVAHGRPFSKVVRKDQKTLEGQVLRRDVVETYAPLMAGDRFLGAFELYYDITATRAALHRLLTTAQVVGAAISALLLAGLFLATLQARRFLRQRDEAEERLRRANRDLALLLDFTSRINKTLTLDELLAGAFATLMELHVAAVEQRGGIFLVEGDHLRLAFHAGHSKEFVDAHRDLCLGQCLCGRAAERGETIVSASCDADPDHTLRPPGTTDHGHIILPLKAHHEVVGVLYLYTAPGATVAPDRLQVLEAIGGQLGIMIKNAQLYETTRSLSLHDPLTGLANRRFMELRLRQEFNAARRYRRPMAVLLFDIDHFKRYNDTFGHEAGDQLLTAVAKAAAGAIRDTDFIARYDGEEFLVILGAESAPDICRVAQRLRSRVAVETPVTVSIGGAGVLGSQDPEEVIRRAGQALYRAKEDGRNRAMVWQGEDAFTLCTVSEEQQT